jgi:hypothetical protein
MTALYTPGPWRPDGHGTVLAGEPGNECSICEVYGGATGDPAELLANEWLIAAAPTLFLALGALVAAVHAREPGGVVRALYVANAALTLADVEGGSHG